MAGFEPLNFDYSWPVLTDRRQDLTGQKTAAIRAQGGRKNPQEFIAIKTRPLVRDEVGSGNSARKALSI